MLSPLDSLLTSKAAAIGFDLARLQPITTISQKCIDAIAKALVLRDNRPSMLDELWGCIQHFKLNLYTPDATSPCRALDKSAFSARLSLHTRDARNRLIISLDRDRPKRYVLCLSDLSDFPPPNDRKRPVRAEIAKPKRMKAAKSLRSREECVGSSFFDYTLLPTDVQELMDSIAEALLNSMQETPALLDLGVKRNRPLSIAIANLIEERACRLGLELDLNHTVHEEHRQTVDLAIKALLLRDNTPSSAQTISNTVVEYGLNTAEKPETLEAALLASILEIYAERIFLVKYNKFSLWLYEGS